MQTLMRWKHWLVGPKHQGDARSQNLDTAMDRLSDLNAAMERLSKSTGRTVRVAQIIVHEDKRSQDALNGRRR
jgi:hypothetical protein